MTTIQYAFGQLLVPTEFRVGDVVSRVKVPSEEWDFPRKMVTKIDVEGGEVTLKRPFVYMHPDFHVPVVAHHKEEVRLGSEEKYLLWERREGGG